MSQNTRTATAAVMTHAINRLRLTDTDISCAPI
jgi:hypothetical protein